MFYFPNSHRFSPSFSSRGGWCDLTLTVTAVWALPVSDRHIVSKMSFTSKWYHFPFWKHIRYKVSRNTLEVHSSLGKSAERLVAAGVYLKSYWHLWSNSIKKLLLSTMLYVCYGHLLGNWSKWAGQQLKSLSSKLCSQGNYTWWQKMLDQILSWCKSV